jgi:hypothetical protein
VARRDDARVGRARVPPNAFLLLDERDLVPVLSQVVPGRDPGDAAAQDEHPHVGSSFPGGRRRGLGPPSLGMRADTEGAPTLLYTFVGADGSGGRVTVPVRIRLP